MKLLLFLLASAAMAQTAAKLTPDGKYLLVADKDTVAVVDPATTKELSRTPVPEAWIGLTTTKSGDRVYVGGGSKGAVYEFTFAGGALRAGRAFPVPGANTFIGDVQLAPDGHLLYAADLFHDSVVVINPQSGFILSRIKTGRRPYRILFHPSGKSFYVSSFTDGAVGQYEAETGTPIANVRVGAHASEMAWTADPARLFVAARNTNSVYVFAADDSGSLRRIDSMNLALNSRQPLGTTPRGMSVGADGKRLYVACEGIDATAAIDISEERGRVMGFIPSGPHPVAEVTLRDGRVATLGADGVQVNAADDEAQLLLWTADVLAKTGYSDTALDVSPVPSPKRVLYIVKGSGNTDLATAAFSSDFPEPTSPPAGYIWTAATQAGITVGNYGFATSNIPKAPATGHQITDVGDPILAPLTDPDYRGFDPAYPDSARAKEFISDLADLANDGKLPQLILVRLNGDDAVNAIKQAAPKDTAVFVADTADRSLSVLRAVEITLGLRPMTIFDAAARPALP